MVQFDTSAQNLKKYIYQLLLITEKTLAKPFVVANIYLIRLVVLIFLPRSETKFK